VNAASHSDAASTGAESELLSGLVMPADEVSCEGLSETSIAFANCAGKQRTTDVRSGVR
jgi:hypothetical protein